MWFHTLEGSAIATCAITGALVAAWAAVTKNWRD